LQHFVGSAERIEGIPHPLHGIDRSWETSEDEAAGPHERDDPALESAPAHASVDVADLAADDAHPVVMELLVESQTTRLALIEADGNDRSLTCNDPDRLAQRRC
jgi:hypothetical protein